MTQLQAAIEADRNLSLEDKAEAFAQVIVLAEAAKNPTKEIRQKSIRTAIKIVKGTIADLP